MSCIWKDLQLLQRTNSLCKGLKASTDWAQIETKRITAPAQEKTFIWEVFQRHQDSVTGLDSEYKWDFCYLQIGYWSSSKCIGIWGCCERLGRESQAIQHANSSNFKLKSGKLIWTRGVWKTDVQVSNKMIKLSCVVVVAGNGIPILGLKNMSDYRFY